MNTKTRALVNEFEKNNEHFKSLVPSKTNPDDKKEYTDASNLVKTQTKKDLKSIAENKDFKNLSLQANAKEVAAEIWAKNISTEYKEYALKKSKEKLAYKIKKEKNIIKAQTDAEVAAEKRKIAEKRYGYLYEYKVIDAVDENGKSIKKVVYKNFTTNNFINKYREFCNWYNGLSDATKNFIKGSLRFLFWGCLATIVIVFMVKGSGWLIDKGLQI